MLEILAGPYPTNVPSVGAVLLSNCIWDDEIGFFGNMIGGTDGTYVSQLDGTMFYRSDRTRLAYVLDYQRYGEYLVYNTVGVDILYYYDKRNGQLGEVLLDTGVTARANPHARLLDRYIKFQSGSQVRSNDLDLSEAWTDVEYTFSPSLPAATPVACWTESRNVIVTAWDGGGANDAVLVFYDHVLKTEVGTRKYYNSGKCFYSPRFNIFVRYSGGDLYVLGANPRPNTLSNPAAVETIERGKASQIRVRLTGDAGEACPNELINWTITSGPGALSITQSVTDEDGYAYNRYAAPAVGVLSDVTIQAQAKY